MASANLFQQYLKPARSMSEYSADMDAAESNQLALVGQRRQNEVAGLQLDQTKQGIQAATEKRNALQALAADPALRGDPAALERALLSDPRFSAEGMAMRKSRADAANTEAETVGRKATAASIESKTAIDKTDAKYKALDRHAQELAMVQTPRDIADYVARTIDIMEVPDDRRNQVFVQALAKANEMGIDAWKQSTSAATIPILEKAKMDADNARNAATNATSVANNTLTNQTSRANNAATLARQSADAAAGRGVQLKIASMVDSRQRDANAAGAKAPVAGSPAAKITDANEAIALLDQAEPLLKSATGSTIGRATDAMAAAFGLATPGSISAQKLKALEGALVSKMPKMSGPQSDKDVDLYRKMAGQIGDESVPYERKAAALDTVREIQERYAGIAPGSSRKNGGASGEFSGGDVDALVNKYRSK